jgi:hypothetical protein
VSGLTASQVPGSRVPRCRLVLDGLDPGEASVVTVERSADGGATWDVVQGAWRQRAAGSAAWDDFTVPLGVETLYRAQVDGPAVPDTLTAEIRVDHPDVWLQDPYDPRGALPVGVRWGAGDRWVNWGSFNRASFAAPSEVVAVEGSPLPVASQGARLAAGSLPLAITAPTALVAQTHKLLSTAGVLVLRGFHHPLLPPGAWLAPADLEVGLLAQDQWARWDVECRLVRQPAPVTGAAWLTFDDEAEIAAGGWLPGGASTFGDVAAEAAAQGVDFTGEAAWFEAARA